MVIPSRKYENRQTVRFFIIKPLFLSDYSIFRVVPTIYRTLFLESRDMEPETTKILENIRKKRIEKKISLLNLATNIGISHSHLFYIESKRVIPSIDVVVKIAKSLNVGIHELAESLI